MFGALRYAQCLAGTFHSDRWKRGAAAARRANPNLAPMQRLQERTAAALVPQQDSRSEEQG